MPTPTYDLVGSSVLSSAAASIEFTSLSGYRDYILVAEVVGVASFVYFYIRFNDDSASNYSMQELRVVGSSNYSAFGTATGVSSFYNGISSSTRTTIVADILDANQTNKHKSTYYRQDNFDEQSTRSIGRWANTSAITKITCALSSGNIASGSIFYLYGIAG